MLPEPVQADSAHVESSGNIQLARFDRPTRNAQQGLESNETVSVRIDWTDHAEQRQGSCDEDDGVHDDDSYDNEVDCHGDLHVMSTPDEVSRPLLSTSNEAARHATEKSPLLSTRNRKTSGDGSSVRGRLRGSSFTGYLASVSQSIAVFTQSTHYIGLTGDAYAFAKSGAIVEELSSKTMSLADIPSTDRYTPTITMFFTCLGMLTGLSVFALPFLVARAGLTMAVAVAIGGILSAYGAVLLNVCQYQKSTEDGRSKRVYENYVDMGKKTIKPHGELLMQIMVSSNLLSDIYTMIFCAQVSMDLFRQSAINITDARTWMVIWAVLVFPLFFITRMSILAWFGALAMLSYTVGIMLTYGRLIASFHLWTWDNINQPFTFEYFFIGYGIILNCYNFHLAVPALEASCKHPTSFRPVLKSAFAVNILLKVALAIMSAAAFGVATQGSVLTNLKEFGAISAVIYAVIAVYLYLSYPTTMFVVVELLDNFAQPKFTLLRKGTKGHYLWLFLSRSFVTLVILFVAVCIPSFELVASFVGCMRGTITVVILPIYFYLKIKKREISKASQIIHTLILVVATIMGLVGTGYSIKGMVSR